MCQEDPHPHLPCNLRIQFINHSPLTCTLKAHWGTKKLASLAPHVLWAHIVTTSRLPHTL